MAESILVCPAENCGKVMERQSLDVAPDATGTLALYACPTCGRKAGLIFENGEGMSQHAQGWVENELASRGHFFPSDYGPGGAGPKPW